MTRATVQTHCRPDAKDIAALHLYSVSANDPSQRDLTFA
jgi:hypothetical protein